MATLTHKTTFLLSEDEYELLAEESRSTRKTMGELIRQAIRHLYGKTIKGKKDRWEKLFRAKAPVADWKTIEKEIQRGRLT